MNCWLGILVLFLSTMTNIGMARKMSPPYPGHYLKSNYKRLTIWRLTIFHECSLCSLGSLKLCLEREVWSCEYHRLACRTLKQTQQFWHGLNLNCVYWLWRKKKFLKYRWSYNLVLVYNLVKRCVLFVTCLNTLRSKFHVDKYLRCWPLSGNTRNLHEFKFGK